MARRGEPMPDAHLPIDPDLAPDDGSQPAVPGTGPASARNRHRRRTKPTVLAAIAVGGALGAPARYGVAQWVRTAPDAFPWATFLTNVSGSFALGLILALILERFPPTKYLRPFIATGFLGAYTTYSTFAVETDMLVKDGRFLLALTYAGASLLAGFLAAWAGIWAGRAVPSPPRRGERS